MDQDTAEYLAKEREPRYHAFETWELCTIETEALTEMLKETIEEIQS